MQRLRSLTPAGFFTRRFPDLKRLTSEEGLTELGSKMQDDPKDRPKETPLAGYTYLGQFTDHDLTFDLTPLRLAGKLPVEQTPNFRSARLDLDQLYGGGPNLSPFLYRRDSPRGAERFLIGVTTPTLVASHVFEASPNDLPRNSQGIALTGDPRQDENLIIAQLHVAFLKLHNLVIEQLEEGKLKSLGPKGATLFEQARRFVTWHYQWVVRYDFLQEILDPKIFKQISDNESKDAQDKHGDFEIPVEFSLAAFRFGHSMVRDEYSINDKHKKVSLKNLLELTGTGGGACPRLPADWVIDWQRFFFVGPARDFAQASRAIDTRIALGLHGLPTDLIRLFSMAPVSRSASAEETPDLPVRTLLRGARVGLPAGQDVARALGISPLSDTEIAHGPHEQILTKYGFHHKTPLWYYILKEAEVRNSGEKLGPIGSLIVGDVIMAALRRDPDSYLSVDPIWVPTLPGRRKFGINHLVRFVIDHSWLPPDPNLVRAPNAPRSTP
jgi:hypothetical protein